MNTDNIPKSLYKYRSFDGKGYYKTFLEGKLFFSSPKDFNDAYDTKIKNDYTSGTDAEVRAYFIKNIISSEKISEDEATKKIDLEIENLGIDKIRNALPKNATTHNVIDEDVGICSLSSKKNDQKMWGHYADSNKGFCVEYNYKFLNAFIKVHYNSYKGEKAIFLAKVNYLRNLPIINPFRDAENLQVEKQILSKSIAWDHEAEYRVINAPVTDPDLMLPYGIITGVYFGIKTSHENINNAIEISTNEIGVINYYKAKKKENSFEIEFEEIK